MPLTQRRYSMGDFVSLVITTYNRKALLQKSLESLWQNTYFPHEIIIHDDGSDVDMQRWLVDLQSQGRISRLIIEPPKHNLGTGWSADCGHKLALGKWVIKLDGDEQFSPMWLHKAVRTMDLFPEIRLLHLSQVCEIRHRDTDQEKVVYPLWDRYAIHSEEREGHKIAVAWMGPGGAFMVDQETYRRFGPWYQGLNRGFSEDMWFRARVCPMARYETGYVASLPPPEDNAQHWEKYQGSAWMAVIDPPVVSYHWGHARSARKEARETLGNTLVFERGRIPYPAYKERGDWFGQ